MLPNLGFHRRLRIQEMSDLDLYLSFRSGLVGLQSPLYLCHYFSIFSVVYTISCNVILHWRHNERDGVSKYRRLDRLPKRLFRHRSKKTPKLRVTGLCEGNSPVTGEFPHKGPVTWKMFLFYDVIMRRYYNNDLLYLETFDVSAQLSCCKRPV